ncbi:MAG: hypothetical protein IT198_04130 [Acidimicrobiia bacterium]|nr:hypothetical protein [Acidimicrobiia bacterium]
MSSRSPSHGGSDHEADKAAVAETVLVPEVVGAGRHEAARVDADGETGLDNVEVQATPVLLTVESEGKKARRWRLVPLPPDMRVRERFYGTRVATIAVLGTIVALLVVGGLAFFLMTRSTGDDDGGPAGLGDEPESIETSPGGVSTLPGAATATTPDGAPVDGTAPGDGSTVPGETTQPGAAPVVLQPAFGAYTYKASGFVKDLGTRRYPAEFPASVRASGRSGCWDLTVRYFSDQTQTTTFCAGGDGSLADVGGTSSISRSIGANEATITCESPSQLVVPGMQPGAVTSNASCSIKNSNSMAGTSKSAGPTTYVGLESATVGGEKVETYHVRQDRTVSGSQNGTTVDHLWIATANGMIVRLQHAQTIKVMPPFNITYIDELTANLVSTTPG